MVALENMRSRFNSAAGLQSQGYSDVCELPLAARTPRTHDARPRRDGRFVAHRNLLFTVAYEMLGSAADAEDVLQETWLRWADVDLDEVRDPRAYLVRITTRLSLNRLRTLAAPPRVVRRPVAARAAAHRARRGRGRRARRQRLDRDAARAGDAHADRAGGVRAARGLRPAATTRSRPPSTRRPAAVRQIAHRARSHVDARRPREVVGRAERDAVIERFMARRRRPATCRR